MLTFRSRAWDDWNSLRRMTTGCVLVYIFTNNSQLKLPNQNIGAHTAQYLFAILCNLREIYKQ